MPDGGFNFLDSSPNIGVYSGDLESMGVALLLCVGIVIFAYLASKLK